MSFMSKSMENSCPIYFDITLDRVLTYRRHMELLRKKVISHVALLKRLANSGWGANDDTLRVAALDPVPLCR